MDFITGVAWECWQVVRQSAPYLLLGFGMAGLLYIFLSPSLVQRYLSRGKVKSVIMASLLGAPIPLCSCGVLPAAVSLKKQGANDGATAAFLVATPETGLDSIAITYALFDPIMTVVRPIAAIVTAIAAGLGVNFLGSRSGAGEPEPPKGEVCRIDACCDGLDCPPEIHRAHHTFREKLAAAFRYASVELVGDVAKWFLLGVLIAGLITYLVPDDLITRYIGGGILPMLIMLAVGTPMYVCSTAATPIAVALVLKGLSPGAALVFLLAGPATNATALSVVGGILGRKTMAIYLGSIMLVSVLMGVAVDAVYQGFAIPVHPVMAEEAGLIPPLVETLIGAALLIYMVGFVLRSWIVRLRTGAAPSCSCGITCSTEHSHGHSHEEAGSFPMYRP